MAYLAAIIEAFTVYKISFFLKFAVDNDINMPDFISFLNIESIIC